ncbi:MAG: hypothetical protein LBH16_08230 [Treponema sp.]|jgi:hypothetical protein|nr:hypothetical protein [Treponema sp.]
MTLSTRNVFFKAGIVFCSVSALFMLAATYFVAPFYSTIEENSRRPAAVFNVLAGHFLKPDFYAVHTSLILVVLFSLVGIIIIHFFFEQTAAPEIPYIAIFIVSFSFEFIRLLLPLYLVYDFSSFYLLAASRVLLFVRYIGIFSLFAASVRAAGLKVQKARYVFFILFIAALITTLGVPIDTQLWDTSFSMLTGNTSIFRLLEVVAVLTTVAGFFVAIKVHGSKEYAFVGLGVFLALIGRYLILNTDNWACPFPGILMLSFGLWFICSKLHKINLWL